uniref:Predicted protein n=1 Tax=Hordeum vulgare subsp. vulgare TaxID=112509 RepID=F2DUC4_HORVV|nr:predicted protein [Hordeum vulgare subsp. vulgare]
MKKMSQNLGSLSFLSRFDPSEFYEIAKDLPSTIEINNIDLANSATNSSATSYDGNMIMNNIDRNSSYEDTPSAAVSAAADALDSNIEIIGTHLLVPQNSIAQMLEANKGILDSTIIDFDSFANILPTNNDTIIIPAASNLPSYETFYGPYNFRINIASSDIPVKKSASWTYSSKLNKLYSIPGVACPVEMSVSAMPPYGTQVRIMPIFSKFEHIQDLITRCENHKKSKEFSSDDFPDQALSHFVRCRHPMANYVQDMTSLRESVQIPFERPTTGSNSTTVLLQFMCYSSCIGGSQKPVRIVLTLEHNGEILGRNSFEVKICACPGRDRTTDEKKSNKEEKSAEKPSQNQKSND